MGYCEKVLDLAKRQIGYKESGKNDTKYARYFDVEAWQWFNTKKQGSEWCAIFICWLFCQNEILGPKKARVFLGCPEPKNNCAAGCGYLYDYLKKKGYQSSLDKAKPGDIIFFKSGSKCSHVGIVEKVDKLNIYTIEGNAGNMVKRVTHKRSSKTIYFGIMSPDYASLDKQNEKPIEQLPDTPAPVTAPASPKTYQMKVTTNVDPLRLRSYASGSAPTICLMKKGSIVIYLGSSSGDWLKVKYKTMTGYAHKKYLTKV